MAAAGTLATGALAADELVAGVLVTDVLGGNEGSNVSGVVFRVALAGVIGDWRTGSGLFTGRSGDGRGLAGVGFDTGIGVVRETLGTGVMSGFTGRFSAACLAEGVGGSNIPCTLGIVRAGACNGGARDTMRTINSACARTTPVRLMKDPLGFMAAIDVRRVTVSMTAPAYHMNIRGVCATIPCPSHCCQIMR